jgi:hypothetical protein
LVEDATAYLRDEEGRMASLQLPAVGVLWPTKGKPEEFDYIPSVLGCRPGNLGCRAQRVKLPGPRLRLLNAQELSNIRRSK